VGDRLGVGGMGEVFRAIDTTLKRQVAIKALPASLATDAARVARLRREAEFLASLNHPNIAHIYGLEHSDTMLVIVMELVEGPTLAERIMAGAVPVTEALGIARQVADALDAAHEQGIVHRDLKPANIKVRDDGVVKVLDFGLAKDVAPAGALEGDAAHSPTLSNYATEAGVILGTAAYMAPEQASGKPVDKRADLWAFGVVLLEMLTGCPVFQGETVSHVLAAVLTAEPPWNALPAETPTSIRRLLHRCLQRDRKRRLDSASVARQDVEDALAEPLAASETRAARISPWHLGAAGIGGMLLAALIALGLVPARPALPNTRDAVIRLPMAMPGSEIVESVALSPDARRLAVGSIGPTPRILIRALDSTDVKALGGTEGGVMPFWSPDGTTVAYFALDGRLSCVDVGGGAPRAVTEAPLAFDPVEVGGTWGTADVILFGHAGAIRRVAASGGLSTALTLDDGAPVGATRRVPQFLPGGRQFFYVVGLPGQPVEIRVGTLDSTATVLLRRADSHAVFDANGHLLFLLGSTLMAQRFDPTSVTLNGEMFPVAANAAPGFVGGAASFASVHGVLAYVSPRGGVTGQLTWFDSTGASLGSVAQSPGVQYLNPVLSPDERRVAVNVMDQTTGTWDVWVVDLDSQIPLRLTTDPASDTDAVWSPDGSAIAFASNRGGAHGLYRKQLSGNGAEELLLATPAEAHPTDWSDDGRFLIYTTKVGRHGSSPQRRAANTVADCTHAVQRVRRLGVPRR